MKIGYSITQSEIVAAAELEYGDCATFQIVCPCCRQPIFKKVRVFGDAPQHFLSHYKADSEEARACELRVAAMSQPFLNQWTQEGRGQTLAAFLGRLRDLTLKAQEQAGFLQGEEARRRIARLLARTDIEPFIDGLHESLVSDKLSGLSLKLIEAQIAALPEFKGKSEFWLRRQASYVKDVLDHLVTPPARPNLRFMFGLAIVLYHHRMQAWYSKSSERLGEKGSDLLLAFGAGKSPGVIRKIVERSDRARHTQGGEAVKAVAPQDPSQVVADARPLSALRITPPPRVQFLAGTASVTPSAVSDLREQLDRDAALGVILLEGGMNPDQASNMKDVLAYAASKKGALWLRESVLCTSLALFGPLLGALALVPFPDLAAESRKSQTGAQAAH